MFVARMVLVKISVGFQSESIVVLTKYNKLTAICDVITVKSIS